MNDIFDIFIKTFPLIGTLSGVFLFLLVMNWLLLLRNTKLDNDNKFSRRMIMIGCYLAGLVAVVISLPINENVQNQILALIGVFISGVIAFSSTTIVSNSMAGIMLRITRPFRTGDFIKVGDHFGRVTVRGILDTEIQTEFRELVALPNMFLITHPVNVVRSSGTIVSANLSLGYDVHHAKIQNLLEEAATNAGLEEPFVQIIELGDYSVTYRVNGLLKEVKSLLSTRSNLFRHVLDTLHNNGVEIASPAIMNQRRIDEQALIVPEASVIAPANNESKAEQVAFDKADRAERREKAVEQLKEQIEELEGKLNEATDEMKTTIKESIAKKKVLIEEFQKPIEEEK